MTIHNIEEFARYLETEVDSLERDIYDYTDCGAWIKWTNKEILIGSIVEGSDAEFSCDPLVFPFDSKEYEDSINWLEEETSREWHKANPQFEDIKDFIMDMFAYDEKPDHLYTIEDAAIDLEEHRKMYNDYVDVIDLFSIEPEDYMEAMNDCIKNEWKSEKRNAEKAGTIDQIEGAAVAIVKGRTTEQLVADFEQTETRHPTMDVVTVRGWIMDELERRNPTAFEKWLDVYNASPRKFFL